MDPDLLARRSNNMLGEYEKNQNKEDTLLEFQSIPKVDHQDFVSLLIRSALEAKASLRNKTVRRRFKYVKLHRGKNRN